MRAYKCKSPDSVYIEIKFAHKLDAPAALGVKKDVLDVTPNKVEFAASKDNRKFELSIPLNQDVDPEVIVFDFAHVLWPLE